MLLADIVATSERVASTRARTQKIAALAETLRALAPDEIAPAVAYLSGEPRQGRVGVGYRTLYSLSPPPASEPSISVLELDEMIDRLQVLAGPGSQAARQQLLTDLLSRATAAEGDFIRRLLTGELRQGALAGVMTDAIAKAADVPLASVRRAAMLAGDLCRVASLAVEEGREALDRIGLEVLRPVQPMLASTAADVREAIDALGLSSVEWKLDGARIQAHRHRDEVRLFTRNLNDVTDRLGGVVDIVRSLPAERLVLDGEVLGVHDDDRPEVFQDAMSRFSRKDGSGSGLVVRFFDVLHVDGDDLLDAPLTERARVLDDVTGPWRIPAVLTDDPEVAQAFLDDAVGQGHEGVMVKGASSTYEAGRRGAAWRKIKPVITLDLVVLGAEWGYGRRQGWLSNLHLGARDPERPGEFVMVGKTFKGLTDKTLTWQTQRFLDLEARRESNVVFVRPEQVVEIAIDGVQRSTRYAGGVALRFARVKRYRDDKGPDEADTITSVQALLR
ncbi:MAG TPA: ATP-dependent DNA ligase [Acidimicrobiales bacterium]|nr:ATP-dependent DNA ligase [Acidimicrobiales bacterium]